MRIARIVTLAAAAVGSLTAAWAQFDGPAPLAWRWIQPTQVAPSGVPVIKGDTVFLAVGNRLWALDKDSGNQKWKFPNVDPIPGFFRQGLLVHENTVVAAGDNRLIYAVDATTGQSKWQYSSPVPIQGAPVMAGRLICFALNDNSIMAINVDDGQPAWQTPYRVFAGIEGGLSAVGTTLVFATGANELVSVSSTTQRQGWRARFSQVTSDGMPTIYNDMIYVNSGSWVAALTSTGSMRWQQNVGEPLAFSPAVSPDGCLVVTRDGRALLFDTNNGRPKWKKSVELGSLPSTNPSATGKSFLVPTSNGALNLLNAATGEVTWSYIVRPIGNRTSSASAGAGGGGRGMGGGDGEFGGGGAGGGAGQSSNAQIRVIAVPASGAGIVNGTSLYVLAQDGSLLAFDKTQGVDLTGPRVRMAWPNAGEQISGQPPLEFIFRIEDEAGGVNEKTISVKINGQDVDHEYTRDGFAIVKIASVGKNRPLTDGRKTVTVTASDWLGNTTTQTFTVMIDNTLRPLGRPNIQGTPGGGANPGGGGGRGGPGGGTGIG